MYRLKGIIILLVFMTALTGCRPVPVEYILRLISDEQHEEIKFSDNILFSINNGAAGYGTRAECTDAEIIVYTDKTVKIFMVQTDYSTVSEIGNVVLSEEDYVKLVELADRDTIYNLKVRDGEGEDGSASYITLYDENDETLISKGGYMAYGDEYWEMYDGIKEILKPYDIDEIVDAHREILDAE